MKKVIVTILVIITAQAVSAQKEYPKSKLDSVSAKLNSFVEVDLLYDLNTLPKYEAYALRFMMTAAEIADSLFWWQSYGSQSALKSRLDNDTLWEFARLNYGPYDRLNSNKPILEDIAPKPKGAQFYPSDMTLEEFEKLKDSTKYSPYTCLVRDSKGALKVVPYTEQYSMYAEGIQHNLQEAAKSIGMKDSMHAVYLWERAQAMVSNDYTHSDILWLESKKNRVGMIIGPIETYEDQLLGLKTAYEAYIVVKDTAWSKKLQKYVSLLPKLQSELPVERKYKKSLPGLKSQIGAYDALFYAGDCNSGSKTIAVNLPNDEKVQAEYGTRRLQFKNVMKAKFDSILVPISNVLIDSSQRKYINFNAFFSNTMFHEVAHGLGIKNTIEDNIPVSRALGQYYSALEEGKADVLGLYMITELLKDGELKQGSLEEYYTTFVASIFRSVRFGATSAHGKANMVRFNYFVEKGAIEKNINGTYKVNYMKMQEAVYELSSLILKIQGDGDQLAASSLLKTKGVVGEELQKDLNRLHDLGIPVDVKFNQGYDLLLKYTKEMQNKGK
jgi:predicted nucleic acid-binding protein